MRKESPLQNNHFSKTGFISGQKKSCRMNYSCGSLLTLYNISMPENRDYSSDYPSIAMVFFVSTVWASFFGMLSFRIPSSNFALMSSCVTSSPT